MKTPIVDFVKEYADSDTVRLHMPGHKGKSFSGCEKYDITEVHGADALYQADGIIRESEMNASRLFGSEATFYSAGGSSQCIKAMLCLAKMNSGKDDFTVLASRNVHKSFIYACALLQINVRWLYDESGSFSLCRCKISTRQLENALMNNDIDAVYITSPDYLGNENDIRALASTAHSHNALMLVDNAHGAYLRFLKNPRHPINLGADMCCDSAHKTLPVLTGGAYLHICNDKFIPDAKKALEMFGSTSPSYLILQSLDLCNAYIADNYGDKLAECIKKNDELKEKLTRNGWKVLDSDPLKLTVLSGGMNLSEKLRKHGIECEYEDPDYTVMMFTPEIDSEAYEKILQAFGHCPENICISEMQMPIPEKCFEIHDAVFRKSEKISVDDAVGRVVSDTNIGCPPAVPVVVSGERISEDAVNIMKHYGIENIQVIK